MFGSQRAAKISQVFVLMILLQGCTTLSAPSPKYSDGDLAGKGLVLLSTSSDSTSASFPTSLVLVREHEGIKQTGIEGFLIDSPFQKSHSASEIMNVSWRVFEPGKYILSMGVSNPYTCLVKWSEYHFSLNAGDRLYLGNFHLQNRAIQIRDRFQRDHAYFLNLARLQENIEFTPAGIQTINNERKDCIPLMPELRVGS